jgi:hypothetical protein
MASVLAIQILFVYLGGAVLRTVPLEAKELLFTLALSLSVFPIDILRKFIRRILGKKDGF